MRHIFAIAAALTFFSAQAAPPRPSMSRAARTATSAGGADCALKKVSAAAIAKMCLMTALIILARLRPCPARRREAPSARHQRAGVGPREKVKNVHRHCLPRTHLRARRELELP